MIIQCAWCKKKMGEIEPRESSAVSHGICPKCLADMQTDIQGVKPMKNHPKKGSKEAFEWARRMQAARKNKDGRPNPLRRSKPQWFYDASMRGWILDLGSHVPAYTIKPTGSGYRLSIVSGNTTSPILDATELEDCMSHVDQLQGKKFKRNPGAAYHEAEAVSEEVTERRAAKKGKVTQAAFHRGKAAAHRQSEAKARELKMNPIAVFGNPGQRVSAKVEGVVYNRCIEIRAEKTSHKPGLYRHPFAKKSRVCILALDNGSLLIHSMAGERLWGIDNEL